MEQVVQRNAATAEESAASASELENQAQTLSDVVVQVNRLVKGSKAQNEQVNTAQPVNNTSKRLQRPKATQNHIVAPNDVIPFDDSDGF